jgi:hypothetical protein
MSLWLDGEEMGLGREVHLKRLQMLPGRFDRWLRGKKKIFGGERVDRSLESLILIGGDGVLQKSSHWESRPGPLLLGDRLEMVLVLQSRYLTTRGQCSWIRWRWARRSRMKVRL